MTKNEDRTQAGKPSPQVKGGGADISGKHPPEYGEIERGTPYEERDDDETE
ncbi:MAG TPA: hypothetical protein VGZ02_11910 [Candidatus Baltobacteraceae bacterium]|jgi:hypothetical protein|nr:hypothetical protein [Candidatus Baltobacteraceae bacterium]